MVLKDKKTKITFHHGMRTIGGTYIEICYENSRIIFDFGSQHDVLETCIDVSLNSILERNLAPYIENIFDRNIDLGNIICHENFDNLERKYENTAVFVSHVHLDHSKMINFLDKSIPLYMSELSKKVLNSVNIDGDFIYPNVLIENTTRDILGVKPNEVIQIGEIKVRVVPVDHDAYGASGFIIETPDLKVSYTGDIRFHGYRKDDTLSFCDMSKDADVLIIEGVSVSFQEFDEVVGEGEIINEQMVVNTINKIVEDNPSRQISFNFYTTNIERLLNIIDSNPRKVVLDAYHAYILFKCTGKKTYFYNLTGNDYGLDKKYNIDFNNLLKDKSEFFWQLNTQALDYLDNMDPKGIYIHSNAAPLGEYDPNYLPFRNNIEGFGIEFLTVACSGHAHPMDLINIIDLIKPKLLVPIHSFRPEKLYNNYGDVLLPETKQTI